MKILGSPREVLLLMFKEGELCIILCLELSDIFRNMKPSIELTCNHCTVQFYNRDLKIIHKEEEFGNMHMVAVLPLG